MELMVPGATIHYEMIGSGPVLLLITGGIYDADGFAPLAAELAARYTVVTYDRRGNSRSGLDGEPYDQTIAEHADDAHRLLAQVSPDEPARVFGNSSGAIIGLELAARHPEQVRTLVAHEPPVFTALPDASEVAGLIEQVGGVRQAAGWGAALGMFGAAMTSSAPDDQGGDDPGDPESAARMMANAEFFITHEVPPFAAYEPDYAALKATTVTIGAGQESVGDTPHRAALAVAERLGVRPVLFPGGHGGFGTHAAPFAECLDAELR